MRIRCNRVVLRSERFEGFGSDRRRLFPHPRFLIGCEIDVYDIASGNDSRCGLDDLIPIEKRKMYLPSESPPISNLPFSFTRVSAPSTP